MKIKKMQTRNMSDLYRRGRAGRPAGLPMAPGMLVSGGATVAAETSLMSHFGCPNRISRSGCKMRGEKTHAKTQVSLEMVLSNSCEVGLRVTEGNKFNWQALFAEKGNEVKAIQTPISR